MKRSKVTKPIVNKLEKLKNYKSKLLWGGGRDRSIEKLLAQIYKIKNDNI